MEKIQKNTKKKNEHNVSRTKLKLKKEKDKKEKNSKEAIDKDNNNNNGKKKNIIMANESKKNQIKIKKTIEEQLNDQKEREQNLLEKKSEVLRRYLSENIMPLLAKGVLHICHNLPDDPVEALANYLLDNSFDLQKDLDRPIGELEKIMQETEH